MTEEEDSEVYVNHIILKSKGVKRNRRFLKLLYTCDALEEPARWFDKLDCSVSIARQIDHDMTLDRFLGLIVRDSHITLQLNYPRPREISYCAVVQPPREATRFTWLECPYTGHNIELIAGLYRAAFNIELSDEPAEDMILAYYKRMTEESP